MNTPLLLLCISHDLLLILLLLCISHDLLLILLVVEIIIIVTNDVILGIVWLSSVVMVMVTVVVVVTGDI
jgi:hypothetical protein